MNNYLSIVFFHFPIFQAFCIDVTLKTDKIYINWFFTMDGCTSIGCLCVRILLLWSYVVSDTHVVCTFL